MASRRTEPSAAARHLSIGQQDTVVGRAGIRTGRREVAVVLLPVSTWDDTWDDNLLLAPHLDGVHQPVCPFPRHGANCERPPGLLLGEAAKVSREFSVSERLNSTTREPCVRRSTSAPL